MKTNILLEIETPGDDTTISDHLHDAISSLLADQLPKAMKLSEADLHIDSSLLTEAIVAKIP